MHPWLLGSVTVFEAIEQSLEHARHAVHLLLEAIHLIFQTVFQVAQAVLELLKVMLNLFSLADEQLPITQLHDLTLRVAHRGTGLTLGDFCELT